MIHIIPCVTQNAHRKQRRKTKGTEHGKKKKKNEPKIATFHVAINGLRGREWAKAEFK